MVKVLAVNGSPRLQRGNTALLLEAFTKGMEQAGAEVETVYASKIKVQPCSCSRMACWYETPGACVIKDSMQTLYPKLEAADHVILATPVYIPLPGDMQNILNRLCPLITPRLVFRDGRTRAEMRAAVAIQDFTLVATSGWWELGNMDTVVRIVRELAEDASVPFTGALLRPHASLLRDQDRNISTKGETVLQAARTAGIQLIQDGVLDPDLLQVISQPLIAEQDYLQMLNAEL
jgi:multimeric flavodoxin WrbA